MFQMLLEACQETIVMVFSSGFLAIVYGFPLGLLLAFTKEGRLFESPWLYKSLNIMITLTASIPFVALMVALIPLTHMQQTEPHNNIYRNSCLEFEVNMYLIYQSMNLSNQDTFPLKLY